MRSGVFQDQIARVFGYLHRCACASQQEFWAKIDGFDSAPTLNEVRQMVPRERRAPQGVEKSRHVRIGKPSSVGNSVTSPHRFWLGAAALRLRRSRFRLSR
jgi:hypothetical protein